MLLRSRSVSFPVVCVSVFHSLLHCLAIPRYSYWTNRLSVWISARSAFCFHGSMNYVKPDERSFCRPILNKTYLGSSIIQLHSTREKLSVIRRTYLAKRSR